VAALSLDQMTAPRLRRWRLDPTDPQRITPHQVSASKTGIRRDLGGGGVASPVQVGFAVVAFRAPEAT